MKVPYLLQETILPADVVEQPLGIPVEPERVFWMGFRQTLLNQLDLVERKLGISPRTSELRKRAKDAKMKDRT